ncbi:MAG: OmpH family outer membrane protein [Deinococcales bacterium]|nr:OmpH family outer membrane protein [Deinococcales bacterium]
MRRLTLLGIGAAFVVALLANNLTAQQRPTKVVYVDSQAAIRAHPSGAQIEALQQQAAAEVQELSQSLAALEQKAAAGEQLTADESDRYSALRSTLTAVQNRYLNEINAAAEPAVTAVNDIIAQLAQENGYTLVLDAVEAANLRLVVYADADLDITPLVIERVEALQ